MMLVSARVSLLLAILAHVGCCVCQRSPLTYLPIRKESVNRDEIKWVVEQIDSGKWGRDVQTLSLNLRHAKEAALSRQQNRPFDDKTGISKFKASKLGKAWLFDTISDYERFSHEQEKPLDICYEFDVRALVDLMIQRFSLKKIEFQKLRPSKSLTLEYLREFAPRFFSRCLLFTDGHFQTSYERMNPNVEPKLDVLVGSIGEQHSTTGELDERLAIEAEKLDLAQGKFNPYKMLKAVDQYIERGDKKAGWSKCLKSAESLYRFINSQCRVLRLHIASPVDVYNMARVLVPDDAAKLQVTSKFRKLNEYSRICIPFRYDGQKVLSNIKNNMMRIGIESALG